MRLISTVFLIMAIGLCTARADSSYGGAGAHGIPQHGILPGVTARHYANKGRFKGSYGRPYYGYGSFPYPYPYRYREPHFGYWPERLGYRYGRSYYGDGGYFKTEPYAYGPPTVAVYPEPEVAVVATETPAPASTQPPGDVSGWMLIAKGDYPAAIRLFGDESTRQPHAGSPKIGYALAVALGGDLGSGVWAMRNAVAIDPQSLGYLYPDGRLRGRVAEVRQLYEQRLSRDGDPDAAFMVASLSYLAGDQDSARVAVARALGSGDSTQSTQNLLSLLGVVEQVSASGD